MNDESIARPGLRQQIGDFLDTVADNHDILRFVYQPDVDGFVPGKTPVRYSGPYWNQDEITAAIHSLMRGKWLTSGEETHQFEIAFSRKFKVGHSLMVNSGSSANLALIGALKRYYDWQDGDEIILSVVGFPTTLAPIIQHGLKPVFVDIELDSLNFDVEQIASRITERTRAIFVSPVLGNAPDMDRIAEICDVHDIELVLDNCDSLGSTWRGRYLNEYAVASSCSFYPAHHISTGEGGMVSSDIEEIVTIARSIAWWGRDCHCVGVANMIACGTCGNRFDKWLPDYDGIVDHRYVFSNVGYNLKPMDLQGAIGRVQLGKFEDIDARRRNSKSRIMDLIRTYLPQIHVPGELPQAQTCWFGTPLVCPDGETKQALVSHLEANKIQTRNYFAGNILLQPAYRHLGRADNFPMANEVLKRIFFIGAAPHYNDAVFDYIADVLKDFSTSAMAPLRKAMD